MEMEMARRLFTSKSAVIRHILQQIPPEEKPSAAVLVERCINLVRKLPEDMQTALLPIQSNFIYQVRKDLKMRKKREGINSNGQAEIPPGKRLVRWHDWEEDLIAEKVVELRLQNPHASIMELCRAAQPVLPEQRRRFLRLASEAQGILQKVDERMKGINVLIEKGRKATETKPQPTAPIILPAPTIPPPPSMDEILEDLSDETLIDLLKERRIPFTTLIPHLIQVLMDKWTVTDDLMKYMKAHEEKMDSILDYLTSPQPPIVRITPPESKPTPPQAPPKPAVRKPRYAVAGLRKDHQKRVESACGHLVDLRFIDWDLQTPTINKETTEYVIIFAKFTNHSMQDHIKTQIGSEKIIRVAGGIPEGINVISRLAKGLGIEPYRVH
jgi:hypothetical protein